MSKDNLNSLVNQIYEKCGGENLKHLKVNWGPGASNMTAEERAAYLLNFINEPCEPIDLKELDANDD